MKIQCVITTHLIRLLTMFFYESRYKWTATAGIGIHPTKPWLSQLMRFKKAISTLEERYVIKFCFKLGKNAMRWKLDLLLWRRDKEFPVEACLLSQTQEGHPLTFDDPFFWQHLHDLHALGSHWTDSQQGIICWNLNGVQEEIPSEETSTLQIESVAFPLGLYTSPQLHPCHRLFEKTGIKTVPQPPYSSHLASCDFWLFPKLRGCRYETTEEMKEAVTKVIDMLKQEDFHGAFRKLLER